jgi:hypothetical protein
MVPFSFKSELSYSRVMKKYSSTLEVWTPGAFSEAWYLHVDVFALSCLPAFLIIIPTQNFRGFKVI